MVRRVERTWRPLTNYVFTALALDRTTCVSQSSFHRIKKRYRITLLWNAHRWISCHTRCICSWNKSSTVCGTMPGSTSMDLTSCREDPRPTMTTRKEKSPCNDLKIWLWIIWPFPNTRRNFRTFRYVWPNDERASESFVKAHVVGLTHVYWFVFHLVYARLYRTSRWPRFLH